MILFLVILCGLVSLNLFSVVLFVAMNSITKNTPQYNFIISSLLTMLIVISFYIYSFTLLQDIENAFLFCSVCILNIFIIFQFVNLMTTSIRLKILSLVAEKKEISEKELIDLYGGKGFIENRFKRLESLSQIERQNNTIILKSELFYWLSQPIYVARHILNLKGEETIKKRAD